MMRKIVLSVALIVGGGSLLAREKTKITFESVQNGRQLDSIPQTTVADFFQKWMNNTCSKLDLNWHLLLEQDGISYFGKHSLYNKIDFFVKVPSDSLRSQFYGYKQVNPDSLRNWVRLKVPQNELQLVAKAKCNAHKNPHSSVYFRLEHRKILTTFQWHTWDCSAIKHLDDKKYTIILDLVDGRVYDWY